MADARDLTDKSTKEISVGDSDDYTEVDYVFIVDADTGEPEKVLISELSTVQMEGLPVGVASGYTNADYVVVIDAVTSVPVKMLISQLDTLIA